MTTPSGRSADLGTREDMRRLLLLPLLLVLALGLAACGDDEGPGTLAETVPTPAPEGTPYVSLREAEAVLEQSAGLELVRTGVAPAASEVPQPHVSTRYEEQTGREFDLLVLPTPALAFEAQSAVEGEVVRGANLLAVFDEGGTAVQRRVETAFGQLAEACRDGGSTDGLPEEVVDACAIDRGDLGPTDEVPEEEPAPEGSVVELGGIGYRVLLARQLNPAIQPDQQLVGDVQVPDGQALFGVFLEGCALDGPAAPDAETTLTTALGDAYEPIDLPAEELAFTATRLQAEQCEPDEGSVAERTFNGGAALVFQVPLDAFENRPLALRLRDGGEERRLQLDL